MRKYKVLNIITRLDKGGSTDTALAIAQKLNTDEYDCWLLAGRADHHDASIKRLIENKKIQLIEEKALCREINPLKDLLAFVKLFILIKNNKYDLVHTHCSKAGILGRWAAYLAGVKNIIHTPHGHLFYGYYGRVLSLLIVLIEKLTATFTVKIAALTAKGIDEHLRYAIAQRDKFTAIHPGVNLEAFLNLKADKQAKRQELNIPQDAFVICSVTRLEKVKNNSLLIKAFGEVLKKKPDCVLIIAGDGPEKKMLIKLSSDLGILYKIKFLGFRDDIPELMNICDVFALSSANEGFGKVFVQAASLAKPSVATDVGGVECVVLDGKTGLLSPPGDYKTFADFIIRLIENPLFAQEAGSNAKKRVLAEEDGFSIYSEESMLHKYKNLYSEVLDGA